MSLFIDLNPVTRIGGADHGPNLAQKHDRHMTDPSESVTCGPQITPQLSFIRTIPPMIITAAAIRIGVTASPSRVIPRRNAPTEPMPVQTT